MGWMAAESVMRRWEEPAAVGVWLSPCVFSTPNLLRSVGTRPTNAGPGTLGVGFVDAAS
jgi:hypothetical protein